MTTADLNVRMVGPFLAGRAEATDGCLDLEDLTAGEVAAFVVAQSRQRPKSVKRMVTALRSLLGFLHVGGPDRPAAGGALAGRVDAVRPAQGAGR